MDSVNGQVILASHRAAQWRERHAVAYPTTRRAAFAWGMAAAVVAISQDALAQTGGAAGGPNVGTGVAENTSPFTTVNDGICKVSGWLRGPVGIGLVLIAIIVAGISLAVGGKKSTSVLIAALGGAAVILGARSIMSLASGSTTSICPSNGTGAATPTVP